MTRPIPYWDQKTESLKMVQLLGRLRLKYPSDQAIMLAFSAIARELGYEASFLSPRTVRHIIGTLKNGDAFLETTAYYYAILHFLYGEEFEEGLYDPQRIPPKVTRNQVGETDLPRSWTRRDYTNFQVKISQLLLTRPDLFAGLLSDEEINSLHGKVAELVGPVGKSELSVSPAPTHSREYDEEFERIIRTLFKLSPEDWKEFLVNHEPSITAFFRAVYPGDEVVDQLRAEFGEVFPKGKSRK